LAKDKQKLDVLAAVAVAAMPRRPLRLLLLPLLSMRVLWQCPVPPSKPPADADESVLLLLLLPPLLLPQMIHARRLARGSYRTNGRLCDMAPAITNAWCAKHSRRK